MGLRADELISIRGTVQQFLQDTCTITRTAQTVMCRVTPDTREVHLEGLPEFMRVRRWRINFPDATDVRPGDQFNVAGMGTYLALEVANPRSYSVSSLVYALMLADPAGIVPFITNAQVTFRSANTRQEMSAAVLINDMASMLVDHDETPGYEWAVVFDSALTYANGDLIAANDEIAWARLGTRSDGTSRRAVLTKPRPHALLPVATAYFNEKP